MPIVSNAGPILSFARAGKLDLLQSVVAELLIPDAVGVELGGDLVEKFLWLGRRAVGDRTLVEALPPKLHLGEREAIVLAKEMSAGLLIDDREARREAAARDIVHFGSLRVLKRAKEQGLLVRIKPVLDDLVSSGTYIGKALYQEFLRQAGEG
jgi:predicted nucleic acid-binding protein